MIIKILSFGTNSQLEEAVSLTKSKQHNFPSIFQSYFPPSAKMPRSLNNRTILRESAAVARDKINKTIEEVSRWSDEPTKSTSSVCHMSEFEDLVRASKKRKDSLPDSSIDIHKTGESSSKMPAINRCRSGDSGTTSQSSDSTTPSITTVPSFLLSENEREPTTEERENAMREFRAADRQQHSCRPMMLSRRLSYRISDTFSPNYSPIAACKLWFPPNTETQQLRRIKQHNHRRH